MRIRATASQASSAGRQSRNDAIAGSTGRELVVTAPVERARPKGHRIHRSSAFLAHLAQQYDGIAERRRQRAERLEAALAGYDGAARRMAPQMPRSSFALRV